MTDYYTENLAEFGIRELRELKDILVAWLDHGLPVNFENDGVRPAMNMSSGYVFLVNADYVVAMLNGETLEVFHSLPYGGTEGFLSEIVSDYNPVDFSEDDIEYILDNAEIEGLTLPTIWVQEKANREE